MPDELGLPPFHERLAFPGAFLARLPMQVRTAIILGSVLVGDGIVSWGILALPSDAVGDGIFRDTEVSGGPVAGAAFCDGREGLWGEFVGLWALALLVPQFLAACYGSGAAGFHTFAEQVAFDLGDACAHGGHHPALGAVAFERHAGYGDKDETALAVLARVAGVTYRLRRGDFVN